MLVLELCRVGSEQIQGNPTPPATTHYPTSITLECTTLMMTMMTMMRMVTMMTMMALMTMMTTMTRIVIIGVILIVVIVVIIGYYQTE